MCKKLHSTTCYYMYSSIMYVTDFLNGSPVSFQANSYSDGLITLHQLPLTVMGGRKQKKSRIPVEIPLLFQYKSTCHHHAQVHIIL